MEMEGGLSLITHKLRGMAKSSAMALIMTVMGAPTRLSATLRSLTYKKVCALRA
jgi:predicted protein tyrosine phosphatase